MSGSSSKGFALSFNYDRPVIVVVDDVDTSPTIVFLKRSYNVCDFGWEDALFADVKALLEDINAYKSWQNDLMAALQDRYDLHDYIEEEDDEAPRLPLTSYQDLTDELLTLHWMPYRENSIQFIYDHPVVAWKHPKNQKLFVYTACIDDQDTQAFADMLAMSSLDVSVQDGPHTCYKFEQ